MELNTLVLDLNSYECTIESATVNVNCECAIADRPRRIRIRDPPSAVKCEVCTTAAVGW